MLRRVIAWTLCCLPVLVEAAPARAGGESKPYTVAVSKLSVKKGQPASAQVVFAPAKGYQLKKSSPTSLKLTLPPGITSPKVALGNADAKLSESQGTFDVVLTGADAGTKTVSGELSFAVCTATTCNQQLTTVVIEMDILW